MKSTLLPTLSNTFTRALMIALFTLGLGINTAAAQDKPAYIDDFNAALKMAKQAQGMAKSNPADYSSAVEKFTEASKAFKAVAAAAEKEGQAQHSNKAKRLSAQLAYKAGMLLHNNGQSEAAIPHFEFGLEVDPLYAENRKGINAANSALKNATVGESNEAMAAAAKALEEGNAASAIALADEALAGELTNVQKGYVYMIKGEAQMSNGNLTAASSAFDQAIRFGDAQIRARAQDLKNRLSDGTF